MAETHLLQIQLGPCAPCHMQCLQNSQDNPAPFVWTSRRKWAWLLESSTAGCDDGGWGWVQPVQVRGRFYSGWRSLLTGSDATIFLSLVLLWTSMPRRVVLVGLHRPFRNERSCSPAPPLLDLKGLLPPKWTRCPRVTLFTAANWAHVRILASFWPAHSHF